MVSPGIAWPLAWVAGGVTATHAGGDGDLFDKLREELPALGVESALLVLDGGPLGMAAHEGPEP
jgi:hypothetical protein